MIFYCIEKIILKTISCCICIRLTAYPHYEFALYEYIFYLYFMRFCIVIVESDFLELWFICRWGNEMSRKANTRFWNYRKIVIYLDIMMGIRHGPNIYTTSSAHFSPNLWFISSDLYVPYAGLSLLSNLRHSWENRGIFWSSCTGVDY